MKKLIIALGVAAMTVGVQAATATWNSGVMYYNGDGSALGDSAGTMVADGAAKMYVFTHIDVDDFESVAEWSNKQFFEAFVADNMNSTLTIGANTYTLSETGFNFGASANGQVVVGGEGGYARNDGIYGIGIITLDTNADGVIDAYSASYAYEEKSSTQGPNFSGFALDKNFEGIATTWTATASPVPEPTSGLLLLLGVAGMALRRRRA